MVSQKAGKDSPEPPQARESCLGDSPTWERPDGWHTGVWEKGRGPEAREAATAVGTRAFAATSPTNSASTSAVDQHQRPGWVRSRLRPCSLALGPSAACGCGAAGSWGSVEVGA